MAVLYAERGSVYHGFEGVDVYDIERDARDYYGPHPVVAHPPCAAWSRLKGLAKPRLEIARYLGHHAVECVDQFGGALEHPAHSSLWDAARLPIPGESSERGCTIAVKQTWFGGPVEKPTWLYVARCRPADLPPVPYSLAPPTHCVDSSSRNRPGRKVRYLPKSRRASTPKRMAEWLIDAAIVSGQK